METRVFIKNKSIDGNPSSERSCVSYASSPLHVHSTDHFPAARSGKTTMQGTSGSESTHWHRRSHQLNRRYDLNVANQLTDSWYGTNGNERWRITLKCAYYCEVRVELLLRYNGGEEVNGLARDTGDRSTCNRSAPRAK